MDDPQIWNSSSRFHQAIHFLSCAFHRMRSRSHCLLASLPVGLGVVGGVGVSAINERLSLCRDCSRHSYSSRDLITLMMLSLFRSLCSCHQASSFASSISFESMMLVYGNTEQERLQNSACLQVHGYWEVHDPGMQLCPGAVTRGCPAKTK